MKMIKKLTTHFDSFFFNYSVPTEFLSAFRFLVTLTIGIDSLARYQDWEWLFSQNGLVTWELARTMIPDLYRPLFIWFPTDELFFYFSLFYTLSLFVLAFGFGGRLLALASYVVHVMIMQRNYVVLYGPDFIANCWLLYLILIGPQKIVAPGLSQKLRSVGMRFVQIQLCIIYAYGGMEKLRGITWWRGDAIWNTLANGQLVTKDFGFLSHIPIVVVAMTFATLVWEVYFPVLVWLSRWRRIVLLFGVGLHLSIGFMMNIWTFSLLMIFSYLLFLNDGDREWWKKHRVLRFSR